jgi:hypothetical protein
MFSTYYVYTRFLTWSPDSQYLYSQTVFTKKGHPKDLKEAQLLKELPSIIGDDEVVCAILYVRNQFILPGGARRTVEEIFEEEGYLPYDERVQGLRRESWEWVKDLQVAWDKDVALAGLRQLRAQL